MNSNIWIFISFLFINLPQKGTIDIQFKIVDLGKAFTNKATIPISRYSEKITFVPLETKPGTMISQGARFEITDKFIIVRQSGSGGKYQILLFDRFSGKFVREIGKQGRGPGEFSIFSPQPVDPYRKLIYAISSTGRLIGYDFEGKPVDEIPVPHFVDNKAPAVDQKQKSDIGGNILPMTADNILSENVFAGYIVNGTGTSDMKIAFFSKGGLTGFIPNALKWEKKDRNALPVPPLGGLAKFYRYNGRLNFIEAYCDTLYEVTLNKLIPRLFFFWDKQNAPYPGQNEIRLTGHASDYFFILQIFESSSFIFLRIYEKGTSYLVILRKSDNKVTFCAAGNSGISGLADDIAGLQEIVPYTISPDNELTFIIDPAKLIPWLKMHPEKERAAKLKNKWFSSVDEFSNPVIGFAKLKE